MPRALILVVLAVLGACAGSDRLLATHYGGRQIGAGSGQIYVAADGRVVVSLGACHQEAVEVYAGHTETKLLPCKYSRDAVHLIAPWGVDATAALADAGPDRPGALVAVLQIDWAMSGLDPLDAETWERAERPWRLEHPMLEAPVSWTPTRADLEIMAAAAGRAAGIDPVVVAGGSPPDIVVDEFSVGGGEVLAGSVSSLEVAITNRGAGDAYRLYATTRSSIPALHGLQFSFGRVPAGASVRRKLSVSVPALEESDAMVVLVFSEANQFPPRNFGKRFPLRMVSELARLAMTCTLADKAAEADAGEVVRVRCQVRNIGGRTATGVSVSVSVAGAATKSHAIDIYPQASTAFDLPVRIPSGAKIDERLALEAIATETSHGARTTAKTEITVRRPRLCPQGRLTRAQYQTKRSELEAALAAGDLTREEFDRYDEELVGCLE